MADPRWSRLDPVTDKIVPLLANALGDLDFLDSLLSRGCLSRDQYDRFRRSQSSSKDAARELLSVLRLRPSRSFDSLCAVLQQGNMDRKDLYDVIACATARKSGRHPSTKIHKVICRSRRRTRADPASKDRRGNTSIAVGVGQPQRPERNLRFVLGRKHTACGRLKQTVRARKRIGLGREHAFDAVKERSSDTSAESARADLSTIPEFVFIHVHKELENEWQPNHECFIHIVETYCTQALPNTNIKIKWAYVSTMTSIPKSRCISIKKNKCLLRIVFPETTPEVFKEYRLKLLRKMSRLLKIAIKKIDITRGSCIVDLTVTGKGFINFVCGLHVYGNFTHLLIFDPLTTIQIGSLPPVKLVAFLRSGRLQLVVFAHEQNLASCSKSQPLFAVLDDAEHFLANVQEKMKNTTTKVYGAKRCDTLNKVDSLLHKSEQLKWKICLLKGKNSMLKMLLETVEDTQMVVKSKLAATRELIEKKRKHFVIAIDIGTTHSCYAMSSSSDKYKIDTPRVKIPTALLLKPDGTFHSFGYKALRDYNSQLDENPKAEKTWMYFDRFKMDLHSKPDLLSNVKAVTRNGKQLSLITVFSHVIKYFKDDAIKFVNLHSKNDLSPQDAKWVVTVPSIWNDGAKQIMREAAYKAGLASPKNPERLMIVLDPEAAAVYCKFSSVISADWDVEQDVSLAYRPGMRYILADMGGGTVDVAVHSVGNDHKIRELHHATGGAWGGTYVDYEFERLLERIFDKDLMEGYKSKFPCEWIIFMSKFESAKCTATLGQKLRVELPFQFFDYVRSQGKTVEGLINGFQNENIKFFRGSLVLAYSEAEKLFNKVFDDITCHLEKILKDVENIKYVILVGGFATFPILQQRLKGKLLSFVRVITVRECSLAVVMGAVLYGHDPTLIASRRVKYTYGVAFQAPFEEEFDPDDSLVVDDKGVARCRNRFFIFIEKNEEVETGDEVSYSFHPHPPNATSVNVFVYSSEVARPRHITDAGVRKVAMTILPISNPEKGAEREVEVLMRFGETEIEVVSKDFSSGEEVQSIVDLDFLSHSE